MEEGDCVACSGPDETKRAKARAIACGQYHTAVLLSTGAAYAAGSNQYGACGFGDDSAPEVNLRKPACISSQWCRGACFPAWASGTPQLCADDSLFISIPATVEAHVIPVQTNTFRQCDVVEPCIGLACGDHNTALLNTTGRVLVAGDNSHGQCGHPHADPPRCPDFQVSPPVPLLHFTMILP